MTLRVKTVEYAFDTRLTTLATNTALATATRHDFTAITLTIPETSSRTFRSVHIELHWRDSTGTAYNFSGWRLGIKLGATAFTDTDYTPTALANSGDHEGSIFLHDVTAYFVSNFGSGSTQTAQVGIAIATATATNVNNITAKLVITYEYDDSGLSTAVKTIRLPLQSHHVLLTGSAVEFGTTGGTTNAPANQIPALDTFLPESNKSIKSVWIEFFGNDGGAAVTNFNAVYQLDALGTSTRATLNQALNTGTYFYDIWLMRYIDSGGSQQQPYGIDTSIVHAVKAYSSLTSRFDTFGGILYVTYTYDASSTRVMNELILPLDTNPGYVASTAVGDCNNPIRKFYIEEPGTITLVQSGVVLSIQSPGGATFNLLAGSQTARPYTLTSLVNSGGQSLVHRFDHNSGLSIARGTNTLSLKMYTSVVAVANTLVGFVILNYTSDVASAGEGAHNHSTSWHLANQITSGAALLLTEIATANQRTPIIPESDYKLSGVLYQLYLRFTGATNGISLHAERLSGEFNAEGWEILDAWTYTNDGELSMYSYMAAALEDFDVDSKHSGKLNIETARKYRLHTTISGYFYLRLWITYCAITFTVSGTVSGYTGDGSGITVDVMNSVTKEVLATVTTSAGGTYSTTIFDNTEEVFACVRQDATHVGRSEKAVAT